MQKYSGIAPETERSEKRKWVHFRWACPKFLRQSFHEWAGYSIAQSGLGTRYYQQQRQGSKDHHAPDFCGCSCKEHVKLPWILSEH